MWLPIGLTLIVLLALALAAGGTFLALKWGWPAILSAVVTHMDPAITQLAGRIQEIERDVAGIPKSFLEYQKEVKKIHDRAYLVARRARKELAESGVQEPELEQISTDLQLFDGTGGEAGPVPTMPEGVARLAAPYEAAQAPLTWRQRTFRKKHGIA